MKPRLLLLSLLIVALPAFAAAPKPPQAAVASAHPLATKAGMEHLVLTWAQEVAISRLRVNLFDPGPVATRMRFNAFPGEDQSALPKPKAIAPALVALCLPTYQSNGSLARFG